MTTRKIQGQILRFGNKAPFQDTLVEVWDRDFLLDDKLGSDRTKDDGRFEIIYNTIDTGEDPDIAVRIFRLEYDGNYQLITDIDGPRNLTEDYDFKEILIADWDYDSRERYKGIPVIDSPNSRINSSPQDFERDQALKIRLVGAKYSIRRGLSQLQDTVAKAQDIYPKNYTIKNFEHSRSDKFFVESVLNGFAPAYPTQDKLGRFHVRYNLDKYDWDGDRQAPSVHLILQEVLGKLIPVEIEYRIRQVDSKAAQNPEFGPWVKVTPSSDSKAWDKAKCYFRIAEFIDGQVKGHLGRSHLNVGQYAMALYRNLQKNPILKLLHPHLKGVSAINVFGKDVVFGGDGVLALSPLTGDSIIDVMKDDLGQCDWKDWSPRDEITQSPPHVYAKTQALYWDILRAYIEHFFEMYGDKIELDWKEVYGFSQDLVQHSVPFSQPLLEDGETWYNTNEISLKNSSSRAISSITQNRNAPTKPEIENLKQACAYAIYHATMWHDWRNDSQAKYAGEVDYARFAIDYSAQDTAFQLFVVNVLTQVKHGYILKNEEGDISSEFILRLREKIEDFQELGYDIRDLRSRLNI